MTACRHQSVSGCAHTRRMTASERSMSRCESRMTTLYSSASSADSQQPFKRTALLDGQRAGNYEAVPHPRAALHVGRAHDAYGDRITRLQCRLNALNVFDRSNRLAVDRNDYIALQDSDVLGKRSLEDGRNLYAALVVQAHVVAFGVGQGLDLDTEFRGARRDVRPGRLLFLRLRLGRAKSRVVFEDFGAILNRDLEVHLLAVAIDTEVNRGIDRCVRDTRHEFVAIFHRLAVNRDDDVILLQPRFIGGTALVDFFNKNTGVRSQRLHQIGFGALGPLDAN